MITVDELVHREIELAELDRLLRKHRQHHLLNIAGFPGAGKTTLIQQWIRRTGLPGFHWEVPSGTAEVQRSEFLRVWRESGLPQRTDLQPHSFDFWKQVFRQMAELAKEQPRIFILDNFHLLIEQDPFIAGKLQEPADHWFPACQIILGLVGSDIYQMRRLASYEAPLFGRFDFSMDVRPLPFPALQQLFPESSFTERLRLYAVAGGFPGYLRCLDPARTLEENIQAQFFTPNGVLLKKAQALSGSLYRQGEDYESVLCAIARGATTLRRLAAQMRLEPADLRRVLFELEIGHWIERQFNLSVPPHRTRVNTPSRYDIAHPLLRFFFPFVEPRLEKINSGKGKYIWKASRLDRLIEKMVFPELCRNWVWAQTWLKRLGPAFPENVGCFWSSREMLDVVAVDWDRRWALLGKCFWRNRYQAKAVLSELDAWRRRILPDSNWTVHKVVFYGSEEFDITEFSEENEIRRISLAALEDDLHAADLLMIKARSKPG